MRSNLMKRLSVGLAIAVLSMPAFAVDPPTNVSATVNSGTATVTWDFVDGVVAYSVYEKDAYMDTVVGNKYVSGKLKAGAEHQFAVMAIEVGEEIKFSKLSDVAVVSTKSQPPPSSTNLGKLIKAVAFSGNGSPGIVPIE